MGNPKSQLIIPKGHDYTIVYDAENKELEAKCGARSIKILPINTIDKVFNYIKKAGERGLLQSTELAIPTNKTVYYYKLLSALGVSNIHAPGEASYFQSMIL